MDFVEPQLDEQRLPDPVPRADLVWSEKAASSCQDDDEPINPARQLIDVLGLLDWDSLLKRHQHWSWSNNGLCCPAGKTTPLKRVIATRYSQSLVFRARVGECVSCPRRAQCMRSSKPSHRKEIHVPVGVEKGKDISRLRTLHPWGSCEAQRTSQVGRVLWT